MFKLIQSIFGATRPKRAGSQEATSKRKPLYKKTSPRKTNSIDSKQKIDTVKKELQENIFEKDETTTVKKSRTSSLLDNQRASSYDLDGVSDISDSSLSKEDEIFSEIQKSSKHVPIGSTTLPFSEAYFKNETKEEEFLGQELTLEEEEKKRVEKKKVFENMKFQKRRYPLKLQCPFCKKHLELEESLQLACSHRYHKDCSIKMRLRNRYECDLCEVKNRNRITMGLWARQRSGAKR